jgi:iron complex transport system ATP-binding protein
MDIVKLSDITYQRSGRTILQKVNWSIERSVHWALLGANGSGKTCLLQIVSGYEWATSGQVEVLGRRYGKTNIGELRKKIGWISHRLDRNLPARDRVIDIVLSGYEASLGLYRKFTTAERDKAAQILEFLHCESFSDQPYGQLSQGEQQKVVIARALVNDPDLLILDEPCIGLDPVARTGFLRGLDDLSRRKGCPTLIYVTHHIEEIGPWIRKVLLLKAGRVVAEGSKEEVLNAPNMGVAFGCQCEVTQADSGYRLLISGTV